MAVPRWLTIVLGNASGSTSAGPGVAGSAVQGGRDDTPARRTPSMLVLDQRANEQTTPEQDDPYPVLF